MIELKLSEHVDLRAGERYLLPFVPGSGDAQKVYANGCIVTCAQGVVLFDGVACSRGHSHVFGSLQVSVYEENRGFVMEVIEAPIDTSDVLSASNVCTVGSVHAGLVVSGARDQVFSRDGDEMYRVQRDENSEEVFVRNGDTLRSQVATSRDCVHFQTTTNSLLFVDGGFRLEKGDVYLGDHFRLRNNLDGLVIEKLEESTGEYLERMKLQTMR